MILFRLLLLLDKNYSFVRPCEYRFSIAISLKNLYSLLELFHRRVLILQSLRNTRLLVLDTILRVMSSWRIILGLRPDQEFLNRCFLSAHIAIA